MYRRAIPLFLLTMLALRAVAAGAPAMQWSFTYPRPAREDWLYAIVPTSDGGYLASGYTQVAINATDYKRRGSILKLDVRRSVQWEVVTPNPQDPNENNLVRGVVETSASYVGAGELNQSVRVVAIDKANPSNVKQFLFSLASLGLEGRLDVFSIAHVAPAGGYAVIGRTRPLASPPPGASPGTSFLLRLDEQFQKVASFGTAGVAFISPDGSATSRTTCEKVRVTHDGSGAFSGFIVSGSIPQTSAANERHMFVERFDVAGKRIASRILSIADLKAAGLQLKPRSSLCPADVATLDTTNAIAHDVAEVAGAAAAANEYMILAHVNFSGHFGQSGCSNSRLNGGVGYVDLTAAMVRLDSNLDPLWAKELGRFSGIDYQTPMVPVDGGFLVVGNDATNLKNEVPVRVIKSNLSGDRQWQADYLIPGDLNNCPFAASLSFDDGLLIAGNNDKNQHDFFIIRLGAERDLWMQDTKKDTGAESNNTGDDPWVSEDVWVRNDQISFPYIDDTHVNPRYRNPVLKLPNFVYVRVRNRGTEPASGMVTVDFAKGSTGLGWPQDWNGSQLCCGKPCGGRIGTANVVNILPGQTEVVELEWYPPNPADFASGACGSVAEQGHFCLLARVETSPAAPFGMTFPETPFVGTNTVENNNIIWKNVTILEALPGEGKQGFGFIRNIFTTPAAITLLFDAPRTEFGTVFDYAAVEVTLSPELIRSWRNGGSLGTGIERVGESGIRVLKAGARMKNIAMQGRQFERFSVRLVPAPGRP